MYNHTLYIIIISSSATIDEIDGNDITYNTMDLTIVVEIGLDTLITIRTQVQHNHDEQNHPGFKWAYRSLVQGCYVAYEIENARHTRWRDDHCSLEQKQVSVVVVVLGKMIPLLRALCNAVRVVSDQWTVDFRGKKSSRNDGFQLYTY